MTSLQVMGFFRFLLIGILTCLNGRVQAAAMPNETKDTLHSWTMIAAERLPDLHVFRAGHFIFHVNGEVVVMGGHASGFVPTATAEYYRDGEWHLINMVYVHDNGLGLLLKSGKVLIEGGHEKHLGIGQTFPVEMYDPVTHTFDGFGCLDHKRAMASGLELDSGKVVIAGNWYNEDAMEMFDGSKQFRHVKDVANPCAYPFIFSIVL